MRQSVGMSQQLNIIIIFILIVFALIAASLSYYKAFKVNNVIINSIEKYEGFNELSEKEISNGLTTLGYQKNNECSSKPYKTVKGNSETYNTTGYCVNYKTNSKGYYYEITTYMYIDLPIISIIKIPVKSSTMTMCLGDGSCNN